MVTSRAMSRNKKHSHHAKRKPVPINWHQELCSVFLWWLVLLERRIGRENQNVSKLRKRTHFVFASRSSEDGQEILHSAEQSRVVDIFI